MLRLPINAWCDWLPYLSNWEKFKNHTKKSKLLQKWRKRFFCQNQNLHYTNKTEKAHGQSVILHLKGKNIWGSWEVAALLTSETNFGQWVTDTLELGMIKLTADGDDELPSGTERCYALLCDMGTHQKENFTQISWRALGEEKRSWTEKKNYKKKIRRTWEESLEALM